MSRFVRVAIVCALVLGFGSYALGTETKEEKMTTDVTQESYQRKSITYLGIMPEGTSVPDEDIGTVVHGVNTPGDDSVRMVSCASCTTNSIAPVVEIMGRRIGIKKAIELNAVGTTINAAEAYRIGLVNQVYPADEFNERVDGYLSEICKLSRPVVRMAKRATAMISREEMLAHLERVEKLYLDELMKLEDAHEGLTAFLEKREANWKHK